MSADPAGAVQVDISWSRTRVIAPDTPNRMVIGGDALPIISEAGHLFRESAAVEEYELYGLVTRLERAQPAGKGRVTITTILENPPRQISANLREEDYDRAIQAHRAGVPVICRGNLRKEGRAFVLRNPHGFALEPLDETG